MPSEIKTQPAESPPLLIDAKTLARLCGSSCATIWRWHAAARLPRPLRLTSGTTRWRRTDIDLWVSLGCPDRESFETTKDNGQTV
jgi:predicted DNA-binding transcriptional regulator AlpA